MLVELTDSYVGEYKSYGYVGLTNYYIGDYKSYVGLTLT